jgi:large subunit ribosomal protein L3
MSKLLAKKIKMTQVWQEGEVVPVTVLKLTKDEKEVLKELKEGSFVRVSGTSKGKGFQGVVKRHGFAGGPASHGQKDRLRAPGSIGATDPGRVIPGKKMAGRMGGDRITLKSSKVVSIKPEEKTLVLKGPIPGMNGTVVEISLIT